MLYGFIPKPVSYNKHVHPIDALINYADAHFISWDLADRRFIKAFKIFYPGWAELESVSDTIVEDLESSEERGSQPVSLLEKLVELTLDTRVLFDSYYDM